MIETWRNIPGYNGKYQADINGSFRRLYRSGKTRLITPYRKNSNGRKSYILKLTKDGEKPREVKVLKIMAETFLGPCPDGYVPYHKNGCQSDFYIQNIAYINQKELGKRTGAMARRHPVAKINSSGEIVEVYSSAREAGRRNYMSGQTIADRCNGICNSAFAPDGYAYAWDDRECSLNGAVRRIEQEQGNLPKAENAAFDF